MEMVLDILELYKKVYHDLLSVRQLYWRMFVIVTSLASMRLRFY